MAEETEVKQIPIGELPMKEFKAARAEGVLTVPEKPAPAVEADAEETDESTKETVESKDGEAEKPKSKGGFQKRIDRLIKHTATLEEQLAAAKKELEAKPSVKAEEKPAVKTDAEPQRENFDSEVAYVKALTRWEVKQELKEQRETEAREEQAAKEKEVLARYDAKAIEAQARYDDWKEVMSQDIPIPSIVGDAIVHTIKNGPDVAYYLGKHPEVIQEMLAAHPLEAVAMAVKISEKLSGDKGNKSDEKADDEEEQVSTEPEKPARKAPAPIKPDVGGTTRSSVPLEKMSFRDYKKAREAGRVH
jgi:hypothetical protein